MTDIHPAVFFFLGVILILILLLIFWIVAIYVPQVNVAYKNSVCYAIS